MLILPFKKKPTEILWNFKKKAELIIKFLSILLNRRENWYVAENEKTNSDMLISFVNIFLVKLFI